MKRYFFSTVTTIIATVLLLLVCTGCNKQNLKGETFVLVNETLSAPSFENSISSGQNHKLSRSWNNGKSVKFKNVPEEYAIDFQGKRYTGDYQGSEYSNDRLFHFYSGKSVSFTVDDKLNPTWIAFYSIDSSVPDIEMLSSADEEELLLSAKSLFKQYCSDKTGICPDPVLEVHDSHSAMNEYSREYIVKFYYADEQIKDYIAFCVYYTSKGEISSCGLCAPSGTAPQEFVRKKLSYNKEAIKETISTRCQKIIDEIIENDYFEFVSMEIEDGTIDYVYVDNKPHIAVYTEATINFIEELPDDMVEKWNYPKYLDGSDCLTFVTLLD